MRQRLSRLFTIKTRWEAWLVIYAIAIGAVERGRHYLETYPGALGWVMALACTGVVFLAGAKLLDSVRPPAPAMAFAARHASAARRGSSFGRGRPSQQRIRHASSVPIASRGE